MFDKRKFRPLSRTLVVETQVHEVTANTRRRLLHQTGSVGIPVEGSSTSLSAVVTSRGYMLGATTGFLCIETPSPILVQIGPTQFKIDHQMTITGSFPQAVLVSREDVMVNIVQY